MYISHFPENELDIIRIIDYIIWGETRNIEIFAMEIFNINNNKNWGPLP